MSVSFTANLITHTSIPKRASMVHYSKAPVSLVELDPNDKNDINAIRGTEKAWFGHGGVYIEQFSRDFEKQLLDEDVTKGHFYAVTAQTDDLKNLKSDKILGVMQFNETSDTVNEIKWLETNPKSQKLRGYGREYKNVGKLLVKHVLNTFNKKDIFVQSAYRAINFYKKLGAEQPAKDVVNQYYLYFRKSAKI